MKNDGKPFNTMAVYIKFFLLFFSMFQITSYLFAQKSANESNQNNKTDIVYFESAALFKCGIKLPDSYDPQKEYTLIIGLHGGGSSVEMFASILDSVNNKEFIYAVPQAPYPWLLNKELGYDWALWPTGNGKIIKHASNLIGKYVSDLTTFLKKQYRINDVYLLGFSQGAIFTYIAGIENHNLYKGLVIFSGPGLLEPLVSPFTGELDNNWLDKDSIRSANNLRIFISHGKDDKRVKYELGVESQRVLSDFGYDVTFREFNGGHSLNNKILECAIEWLQQ